MILLYKLVLVKKLTSWNYVAAIHKLYLQEGQKFKMAGVAVIKASALFHMHAKHVKGRASAIKFCPPSSLFKSPHGSLTVKGSIFDS